MIRIIIELNIAMTFLSKYWCIMMCAFQGLWLYWSQRMLWYKTNYNITMYSNGKAPGCALSATRFGLLIRISHQRDKAEQEQNAISWNTFVPPFFAAVFFGVTTLVKKVFTPAKQLIPHYPGSASNPGQQSEHLLAETYRENPLPLATPPVSRTEQSGARGDGLIMPAPLHPRLSRGSFYEDRGRCSRHYHDHYRPGMRITSSVFSLPPWSTRTSLSLTTLPTPESAYILICTRTRCVVASRPRSVCEWILSSQLWL